MKTLNLILTAIIVVLTFNAFAGTAGKMTGTYTIGIHNGTSFKTISDALAAVENNGTSGPVTFIVDKDAYDQQLIISAISKTSAIGNIEFVSSDDQNTAENSVETNTAGK